MKRRRDKDCKERERERERERTKSVMNSAEFENASLATPNTVLKFPSFLCRVWGLTRCTIYNSFIPLFYIRLPLYGRGASTWNLSMTLLNPPLNLLQVCADGRLAQ
jgi:hypothetical protein